MSAGFWRRWLLAVAAGTAVFGLSMVLAPGPVEDFFNWMIFGDPARPEGFTDEAADYLRFTYGVLGAVMFGWMLLIAAVVAGPMARGESWAWTAVAISFAAWLVADTSHSLATGYAENAAFNGVFAVVFAIPLIALRPKVSR